MKNPIIRISVFATLFVLASFAPPSKIKFSSTEGKYSIVFPASYETKDMSTDSYSSLQVQANLDDQLFFVTHNIHTSELTDHEGLAQTSLTSFTEAMTGRITSQKTWQVKKNKGVKAKIEIESLGLQADYGVVLVGQIQYQVAVVSATDKWNQALSDAFFKSFKMKK
jgi:hypothetical protein